MPGVMRIGFPGVSGGRGHCSGRAAEHVGEHGACPGASGVDLRCKILARFGGKTAKRHDAPEAQHARIDDIIRNARGNQLTPLSVRYMDVAAVRAGVRVDLAWRPVNRNQADRLSRHSQPFS